MLHERLKVFRKTKGLTQQQLTDMLKVKKTTYASYEQGSSKPTQEVYKSLYEIFGLSLNWLLTGDGEMFLSNETKEVDKPNLGYLEDVFATKEELQQINEAKAKKEELERLEEELAETQERLEGLRAIVYREHSIAEPEELEVNALEEDMLDKNECEVRGIEIPYLGLAAAAGPLRELDTVDETILVPENLLPVKLGGIFVGRIEGDSMSDIIPDGSNMLLRVCKEPMSGHVYVFTLRGKATIKKFRIDHTGPHFEYMDGSGRSIYPEAGEQWYCNAEFLRVL